MSEQIPPMAPPAPPPPSAPPPAAPPPAAPPPPDVPTAAPDRKGFAIASLVLGILSLCASVAWFCGGPISIVGIILGVIGMKSSGRKLALAGVILSAVGLVLMIIFIIVSLVSGPILQQIQNQILNSTGY